MNDRESMLVEYSEQFKTQGNRAGDYWFLGIEEGGGGTVEEVESMLAYWDRNGRSEESYINNPERGIIGDTWFERGDGTLPKIQKTWGAQIRVLLSMQGKPSEREDVRRYQANCFGTPTGETCLMELLPLPNPGLDRWIYSELSDLDQFRSRDQFIEKYMDTRIERFIELVKFHQPVSVVGVCYGLGQMLEKHLSNVSWVKANTGKRPGRAMIGEIDNTVVAITYHPNTPMTAPNAWYSQLGQTITARSDELQPESLRAQLPPPFAA